MRQEYLHLQAFLEEAVGGIQPTSATIGRVTVEPDYTATVNYSDLRGLTHELWRCIREHAVNVAALGTTQGDRFPISENYPLLKTYVRSVTLLNGKDADTGSWVQVEPPCEAV
ncbi:MAG: hypothetical protein AAB225_04035 [Acidobacteriota bacterium]